MKRSPWAITYVWDVSNHLRCCQNKVPYLHEPSSPSLSSTDSLIKLLNLCALPHETLINQFAKTFNT